jgi:hypothetical protein
VSVTAAPSRPEPVVVAAGAASLLTTLVGLVVTVLAAAHVLTPDGASTLGPVLAGAIPTLIGAASTIAAAVHARGKVTPLSDPRVVGAVLSAVEAGEQVATAVVAATRPAGPQTPGVADHAAPEEAA